MDMQQAQKMFLTELMPLITQGMASGFDCNFVQAAIKMGEQKLQEFIAQSGFAFLKDGVMMAVDFVLTFLGVKHECVDISENALF